MKLNPYRYKRPLEPVKDKIVCVPREETIRKLITGINRGDYWGILGPKQIGKTTILRQLQHSFSNAHYLYFNFETFHSGERLFYQTLIEQFYSSFSPTRKKASFDRWPDNPELDFLDFLAEFKPKNTTGKIILMFDEIDNLPFLSTFLHLWRMIFHERYHREELYRYSVIITGSVDLIAQTIGKTSPFNIAEILTMKDFSNTESRGLIEHPLKQLNLKIEEQAVEKLLDQISGHPQMLQHACFLLVETAYKNPGKPLSIPDVDKTAEILLKTNTSLDTLKQDLNNEILKKLIKDILNGMKRKYYPYKELFLTGAGSIKEENFYCAIRNKIYEEYLKGIIPVLNENKEVHPKMHDFLSNYLERSEKRLVEIFSQLLAKSEIKIVNQMVEKIEQGNINDKKAQEILNSIEDILDEIKQKRLTPPPGITAADMEYYSQNIRNKKHDLQSRLKLSIPLIPLILSYEDAIKSKSIDMLKKKWNWLNTFKDS